MDAPHAAADATRSSAREALDARAREAVADLVDRGLARAPTDSSGGIDLVTNDYLSLRRDGRVVDAARAALGRAGAGAGAARLLGGDDFAHRDLESTVAAWLGAEAAVLFATGTAANVGAITGLAEEGDLLVSEEGNHGSLVDGVRLSGARKAIVLRRNPGAVDRALSSGPAGGRRFVVLETLHGMEGDRADLSALADVCRRRDALLILDEAHAIGVLGADGAGLAVGAGIDDVIAARTVPCGKALAAAGGLVVTSKACADLLVHRSRAYAYSTALAPSLAAAAAAAVRIARAERDRADRAMAAAKAVAAKLVECGEPIGGVEGAFVPWLLGSNERALAAAAALRERRFIARAVRPPTVPEGTARVRLSCHASLADADLERLLDAIGAVVESLR